MKILHTSDWHLGKKLEKISRLPEQKLVLKEICEIADKEDVDAVVIAGDLYDGFNPGTDAIELFYRTLKTLSKNGNRAVIALAGNHDSPDRIEAPNPLARECGIIFSGYPHTEIKPFMLESGLGVTKSEKGFIEVAVPGTKVPLRVLFTPYANEYRLRTYLGDEQREGEFREVLQELWDGLAKKYCDDKGINILATHLYMVKKDGEMPEEPEDEKPILHIGGAQAVYTGNVPKEMHYVALGHLHRHIEAGTKQCPVAYSGSPIAYSMSEAGQKKSVIIVDLKPKKPAKFRRVELSKGKSLERKKFKDIDKAVKWLSDNQNALVELTIVSDTYLSAE
ncbi:exonuclease subunit SbcD, partial [Patescibacteria group bacterium]|nr:exonuclease subunit SbcD [Patescibacteria group bacterium]